MDKELKITCPDCNTILIVDRFTGQIIEKRKPLVENSSGDRLEDAFTKMSNDKAKRDTLFDNLQETQDKKRKAAEELFDAGLKDAADDDEIRPENIFDRD